MLTAEECARVDAERNERDRKARRGYDYDGRGDLSYQWEPGETVMRVFDPDKLFDSEAPFGRCEVCGAPASMVVPEGFPSSGGSWRHASWSEWREAIRDGRHFCSTVCWQRSQQGNEAAQKRQNTPLQRIINMQTPNNAVIDQQLELLASLRTRGCTIRVNEDGRLHINPRKLVTAAELVFIKDNRDELVTIVRSEQEQATSADDGGAAVSTANGESGTPVIHDANTDVVAGANIRLGVIAKQLELLVQAIAELQRLANEALSNANQYAEDCGRIVNDLRYFCDESDVDWNAVRPLFTSCLQYHIATLGRALQPDHMDMLNSLNEQADALSDALRLSTGLLDDVRKDLNPEEN
jgi:hypothetical protein